jgi:hypothetical protein
MEASSIFQQAWVGPAPSDKRQTYVEYPYEDSKLKLPSADLSWLSPLDRKIADEMKPHWQERSELRPFEMFKSNLKTLLRQANELDLSLPATFLDFMSSLELQYRVPSATACYFDLPNHITQSPFQARDWIIRFLNDQQACCAWYLYFQQDGALCVICSYSTEHGFLDDLEQTLSTESVEEIRKSTFLVAPSFDAFLYRFWSESIRWFATHFASRPQPKHNGLASWIKRRLRRELLP